MIKTEQIPAERKPFNSKGIAEELATMQVTDPDRRIKNPFVTGLNFENGEKVTFVGFNFIDWNDKDRNMHGTYPVVVLKSNGNEKTLALSSITKSRVGRLLDDAKNPDGVRGMWKSQDGLYAVMMGCNDLSAESFNKIEKWFGTAEHTISVQWVENDRGYATSLVNVL